MAVFSKRTIVYFCYGSNSSQCNAPVCLHTDEQGPLGGRTRLCVQLGRLEAGVRNLWTLKEARLSDTTEAAGVSDEALLLESF
jgi:hypothetical protein